MRVVLDLCCGYGGWADGLSLAGWHCIGFDVCDMRAFYNGDFVQGDVRKVDWASFRGIADLLVASPVCTEYAKLQKPGVCQVDVEKSGDVRRELAKRVDTSLWEVCRRAGESVGVPWIIENVRGATAVHGRAAWNYGPFHFWGTLPVLMPFCSRRARFKSKYDDVRLKARVPVEVGYWIGKCFAS